jgi:hypothetical protein
MNHIHRLFCLLFVASSLTLASQASSPPDLSHLNLSHLLDSSFTIQKNHQCYFHTYFICEETNQNKCEPNDLLEHSSTFLPSKLGQYQLKYHYSSSKDSHYYLVINKKTQDPSGLFATDKIEFKKEVNNLRFFVVIKPIDCAPLKKSKSNQEKPKRTKAHFLQKEDVEERRRKAKEFLSNIPLSTPQEGGKEWNSLPSKSSSLSPKPKKPLSQEEMRKKTKEFLSNIPLSSQKKIVLPSPHLSLPNSDNISKQ